MASRAKNEALSQPKKLMKKKQQNNKNKINLNIPFIRKSKKLKKIYKLILMMSPQPEHQY